MRLNIATVDKIDRKSIQPLASNSIPVPKTIPGQGQSGSGLGSGSVTDIFPYIHRISNNFQFVLSGVVGLYSRENRGYYDENDIIVMKIGSDELVVLDGGATFMLETEQDMSLFLCNGKGLLKYPYKSNKIQLKHTTSAALDFDRPYNNKCSTNGNGSNGSSSNTHSNNSNHSTSDVYTISHIDSKRIIVHEPIRPTQLHGTKHTRHDRHTKYQFECTWR